MAPGPNIRTWLESQAQAETPFTHFGPEVPPPDTDFTAAATRRVVAPGGPPEDASQTDFAAKARNLARDFVGAPELHLINAKLITLLRRAEAPDHAAPLFRALWAGHHRALAADLPVRWVISSAQTLGDVGATEAQRRIGNELALLFGLVKLYECERLTFGKVRQRRAGREMVEAQMPLDLPIYSFASGDLDRVLITRLLRAADADPVTASLTARLIPPLLADERGLFQRLATRRAEWRARRKAARARGGAGT